MRKAILLLLAACVVAALAPGCGSSGDAETPPPASPAVPGTTTPQPDPSATEQSLRAEVHAYAARMMADIKAAEDRGDVIDGVAGGQSSNPYDYVGVSPAFVKDRRPGRAGPPGHRRGDRGERQRRPAQYLLAAAGAADQWRHRRAPARRPGAPARSGRDSTVRTTEAAVFPHSYP